MFDTRPLAAPLTEHITNVFMQLERHTTMRLLSSPKSFEEKVHELLDVMEPAEPSQAMDATSDEAPIPEPTQGRDMAGRARQVTNTCDAAAQATGKTPVTPPTTASANDSARPPTTTHSSSHPPGTTLSLVTYHAMSDDDSIPPSPPIASTHLNLEPISDTGSHAGAAAIADDAATLAHPPAASQGAASSSTPPSEPHAQPADRAPRGF